MGRSLKKGPYVDEKLFAKVTKRVDLGSREPIKTWARRCTIIPEFVGFTFMVHNGKRRCTIIPEFVGFTFMVHNGKVFNKVFVTEDMVGHKLGEFSPTRVFKGHSSKKIR
jgi:small subunit ribosomal protein S19